MSNPKPPSAKAVKPTQVRVVTMKVGKAKLPYIRVKVGAELSRRGSFVSEEHRCHLLAGSGDDAGQLAAVKDDTGGAFVAKRKADGHYEIAVNHFASAGLFALPFKQFDREGGIVPMNGSPAFITFDAKPIMLNGGGK